jgi:hypothetical protein
VYECLFGVKGVEDSVERVSNKNVKLSGEMRYAKSGEVTMNKNQITRPVEENESTNLYE